MPGIYCNVRGCTNRALSTRDVVYHKIPRDNVRKRKWFEALGQDIRDSGRICSTHFSDESYEVVTADGRRRLKPTAVPTPVFLLARTCDDANISAHETSSGPDPSQEWFLADNSDFSNLCMIVAVPTADDCTLATTSAGSNSNRVTANEASLPECDHTYCRPTVFSESTQVSIIADEKVEVRSESTQTDHSPSTPVNMSPVMVSTPIVRTPSCPEVHDTTMSSPVMEPADESFRISEDDSFEWYIACSYKFADTY
ncbi:uncharacterized protein LOC135386425 [Ornithodoros turicata]|uniref:uncharacterized protein LOC135386425 n=1 Tax=Ornithodoros turicata TaxID=34597 RepID=UPI003139B4AA